MRKWLLCTLPLLCFPFNVNAAQETLSNILGECTVWELGCTNRTGSAGNPNDLIECYSNATLTPPYELTAFTYTIGVSAPPPDTLNLKVYEWSGAGAPGTLITTIPLAPGDLTAGFHNLLLASPVSLSTADFCAGLNSEPVNDGFRVLVTTELTGLTAGTTWVKAPACDIVAFTEMAAAGFQSNYCFTATIEESLIEVAIDIKFCSDPNAFNCKKKGVLPVTIFGTETFLVSSIDPSTLKLCLFDLTTCTNAPKNWSIADRGDPTTDLGAAQCAIVDLVEMDYLNQDTWPDLDAAFEASEVKTILGAFCSQPKNTDSETLYLVGSTFGGTEIFSLPLDDSGIDQLVKKNK